MNQTPLEILQAQFAELTVQMSVHRALLRALIEQSEGRQALQASFETQFQYLLAMYENSPVSDHSIADLLKEKAALDEMFS